MSAGDFSNYGQAQAGSFAAPCYEWLEQAFPDVVRNALPGITNAQTQMVSAMPCCNLNDAPGRGILDRVQDEIIKSPMHLLGIQ